MTTAIPVTRTTHSRLATYDFQKIVFGANPTDHMFLADYQGGAWRRPRIEPFGDLTLSPLALCLHYGQTVFEGFKAYRQADGNVSLFRPDRHHARLNRSLERMCMPAIPGELFRTAVRRLVALEEPWVPHRADASLYLRPFVIATEPRLGVKVADSYLFGIVCLPLAHYYSGHLRVKVETEFVRAVEGGAGAAKCGGNYGAAFYPAQQAKEQGFDQLLWTDALHHEYIEESGTMNVMFVLDEVLVTPPLSGSILDGVTRDSLLTLARDGGIQVEERRISYKELEQAFRSGRRVEAFGVGTAAAVSPIGEIDINGHRYFPDVSAGTVFARLQSELQDIRLGQKADPYHWNDLIRVKEGSEQEAG
ncbi:branched-chain amino acid aminotransferase [Paraflavisolibacter sp. H34]|uniref:branched-chain amino acid aminotransferase n=1 Tax=Huijunlia imazamoxiresistens TaxID=3127457 RepID=UPI003018E6F3